MLKLSGLVGAAASAHGPGPWLMESRPVLRPADGPLGWRLAQPNDQPTRQMLSQRLLDALDVGILELIALHQFCTPLKTGVI